jgi:hypothetical protein
MPHDHQGSEEAGGAYSWGVAAGSEQGCRMSRCARDWVWGQSVTPSQKLVLLALAERLCEDNDSWPCEASLGEHTGLPIPVVAKAIQALEAQGMILCLRLKLMKEKRRCGLSCFIDPL